MKNVLIFPTGDRQGVLSAIHHYNKIGFNVFAPKFESFNLDWSRIAQWPLLISKDPDTHQLNIDAHKQHELLKFGEDFFLVKESHDVNASTYCKLIDEKDIMTIEINIFHTFRGGEGDLQHYFSLKQKFFPHARWVSSSVNVYDKDPGGHKPQNVAKILPANYEKYAYPNQFNFFCSDIELHLFKISPSEKRKPVIASFNHNYHIRQPADYQLFCNMNKILNLHSVDVKNYGGNIRGSGADIRYHNNGPTGNYPTLSPPSCLRFISDISAIVHFKQNDWGGGVFFHALHTHTPIITTQHYVNASNSNEYLVHESNCLIVKNESQAAEAVLSILKDDSLQSRLSNGMKKLKENLFNESYWSNWEKFVQRCMD